MDESLLQFGLKALVTLFVVVDPLGVAPGFVALTSEMGVLERRNFGTGNLTHSTCGFKKIS